MIKGNCIIGIVESEVFVNETNEEVSASSNVSQ